jgi:hypothetical protein
VFGTREDKDSGVVIRKTRMILTSWYAGPPPAEAANGVTISRPG